MGHSIDSTPEGRLMSKRIGHVIRVAREYLKEKNATLTDSELKGMVDGDYDRGYAYTKISTDTLPVRLIEFSREEGKWVKGEKVATLNWAGFDFDDLVNIISKMTLGR